MPLVGPAQPAANRRRETWIHVEAAVGAWAHEHDKASSAPGGCGSRRRGPRSSTTPTPRSAAVAPCGDRSGLRRRPARHRPAMSRGVLHQARAHGGRSTSPTCHPSGSEPGHGPGRFWVSGTSTARPHGPRQTRGRHQRRPHRPPLGQGPTSQTRQTWKPRVDQATGRIRYRRSRSRVRLVTNANRGGRAARRRRGWRPRPGVLGAHRARERRRAGGHPVSPRAAATGPPNAVAATDRS
jgi:hypothetical protein